MHGEEGYNQLDDSRTLEAQEVFAKRDERTHLSTEVCSIMDFFISSNRSVSTTTYLPFRQHSLSTYCHQERWCLKTCMVGWTNSLCWRSPCEHWQLKLWTLDFRKKMEAWMSPLLWSMSSTEFCLCFMEDFVKTWSLLPLQVHSQGRECPSKCIKSKVIQRPVRLPLFFFFSFSFKKYL